jgi:hypothetical protein
MKIDLVNAEELIFYDSNIRNIFPEFHQLFQQWDFSKLSPALRPLGKKSIVDFLNALTKEHNDKLSEYFKTKVTIDNLDYSIVKNTQISLNELSAIHLAGLSNIAISRREDQIYICSWK